MAGSATLTALASSAAMPEASTVASTTQRPSAVPSRTGSTATGPTGSGAVPSGVGGEEGTVLPSPRSRG
jgi:hypothetical protein